MKQSNPQSGQTLIETIVALFILVMALVAGLGLAIYSTSQSSRTRDQIVASNLAREGLEVVRMFRDTNWLAANFTSADDFYEAGGGCDYGSGNLRPCFPDAFHSPYDIETSVSSDDYIAVMDSSNPSGWAELEKANGGKNFLLCLQNDGTYQHSAGGTCNLADAHFARKITVTVGSTVDPYTADANNPNQSNGHSPEKIITSYVVWTGKNCAEFTDPNLDPAALNTNCKVVLTESLSNWKDYK